MDIPESGAVFAFGRSHLTISGDGNDNNYFFIKKDKIKKLICGYNQSAVICESGRLFVWGENPCGQLAIGTCENIVTKPSCVKVIKKMGHTVKDFRYGSNFSVLLTDSNKIFYAGKNIFPFNAKIDSLDGVFQHDITEVPIELKEYEQFNEQFNMIRAGDEHFVVVNENGDKLFGWGFNSHYQLASIDSYNVLRQPDVFFESSLDEGTIKLMECGKLSTCIVTEFNDLHMVGRFKGMTLSTFTKIREPIANSTITQMTISDDDDIYLLTDHGSVYKSINMKNIIELRFEEINFPDIDEKIVRIAPGARFISIMTERGRCFSLLEDDKMTLIESGKIKELNVIDIVAGAQHVLVSTMLRDEDENGNEEHLLNQTYTINFKKIMEMGSGHDNYQEANRVGEGLKFVAEHLSGKSDENSSLTDIEESLRGGNGSRATTLECKDTESSNHSSAQKHSPEKSDSTIRFIDNGVLKTTVVLNINETGDTEDEDHKPYPRKKTPIARSRNKVKEPTPDDLDENGIIDRDEDIYDDNDDVSTSTLHGSEESLQDYINEENKINGGMNGPLKKRMIRFKQFMSDVRDKGKGLSCKTAENVIDEHPSESQVSPNDIHKKSCVVM